MSTKANIQADILAKTIAARTGLVVTQSFDSDSFPLIAVGTLAQGTNTALIKVVDEVSIAKNVIGQAQEVFGPHRIRIAFEDVTAGGVHAITEATKLALFGEILYPGAAVDMYVLATGTAPSAANLATAVTAGATASFAPDIYNPLTNQM